MDDSLFNNLLINLNSETKSIEDKSNCLLENICCQTNHFDHSSSICKQCSHFYSKNILKFKLKILNLSGCYRFTDYGLK